MNYEEAKSQTNKRLLRFAWGLEIFFCIAGVLIAFSLAFSGLARGDELSSIGFTDWLGFGVVGIVLCAIALTELVKIPTVQGILYAKSLKTKVLCSLFLMAICFLTFETMTQGLEQNIANREIAIEKPRIKLISFNESYTEGDYSFLNGVQGNQPILPKIIYLMNGIIIVQSRIIPPHMLKP